jgi:hypothetical protein
MLVVTINLHSAITGEVSELGRMIIANDGSGDSEVGNYDVRLARKGVTDNRKIYHTPLREGRVLRHFRGKQPVWNLVKKALDSLGFKG